jgi:hypothetical protein
MSAILLKTTPLAKARFYRFKTLSELALEAPTTCIVVIAVLVWLALLDRPALAPFLGLLSDGLPWFADAALCLVFLVSLVLFLFVPCLVAYLVQEVFLELSFHQLCSKRPSCFVLTPWLLFCVLSVLLNIIRGQASFVCARRLVLAMFRCSERLLVAHSHRSPEAMWYYPKAALSNPPG